MKDKSDLLVQGRPTTDLTRLFTNEKRFQSVL